MHVNQFIFFTFIDPVNLPLHYYGMHVTDPPKRQDLGPSLSSPDQFALLMSADQKVSGRNWIDLQPNIATKRETHSR